MVEEAITATCYRNKPIYKSGLSSPYITKKPDFSKKPGFWFSG